MHFFVVEIFTHISPFFFVCRQPPRCCDVHLTSTELIRTCPGQSFRWLVSPGPCNSKKRNYMQISLIDLHAIAMLTWAKFRHCWHRRARAGWLDLPWSLGWIGIWQIWYGWSNMGEQVFGKYNMGGQLSMDRQIWCGWLLFFCFCYKSKTELW